MLPLATQSIVTLILSKDNIEGFPLFIEFQVRRLDDIYIFSDVGINHPYYREQ